MRPVVAASCTPLALLACTAAPTRPNASAKLVILDGAVITENPAQPQASALAVRDGKIAYVGDAAGARRWIGSDTRVLRVAGATVLPGLIDSHIHVMEGALSQSACPFADAQLDVAQIAPNIRDSAARTPGTGWVMVVQLNAAGFHADRHDLDAILPDRPLLLWAADGHDGWVNSAALRLAGVDRHSADPPNGTIARDADGEPNGFLVDSALEPVSRLIEQPGTAERERVLLKTLGDLAQAGITTFMEANTSEATVRSYVELARKQLLHARVSMALRCDDINSETEFARLAALRALAGSQPLLRADLIKLFADGVMEYPAHTAAMLEPYLEANGQPGTNYGPTYLEPASLALFVRRAADQGFGLHVHAIGDRAARIALDAFADARAWQHALLQHRAPGAGSAGRPAQVSNPQCHRLAAVAVGAARQ